MCGRTERRMVTPARRELIADRGLREAQLGSDLAQGPALGVQVGRTLKIQCAHRNESQRDPD